LHLILRLSLHHDPDVRKIGTDKERLYSSLLSLRLDTSLFLGNTCENLPLILWAKARAYHTFHAVVPFPFILSSGCPGNLRRVFH
jgi:hypothetical protein